MQGGVFSKSNDHASIGIGALIIFIAMILVAGVTASVMYQTMSEMQERAMQTSQETLRDISTGLRVSHVSGYVLNSLINQLAFFIETTAGSNAIDLSETTIQLSDSDTLSLLQYDNTTFSSSVSSGLFGTVNSSNLTSSEFGILVVRDLDSSCTSSTPIINDNDLIVLLVNTTSCFSGIDNSVSVRGKIIPEVGISGVFAFTSPSSYSTTIVDLV